MFSPGFYVESVHMAYIQHNSGYVLGVLCNGNSTTTTVLCGQPLC